MTAIADRTFTRTPHRAHPEHFPKPRTCTVMWYVDHTSSPAEPNMVRYTTTEKMLTALRTEFDTRLDAVRAIGRGLEINETRPALLLFLDEPLTTLADAKARKLVQAVIGGADSVGIYVALRLTLTDRTELQNRKGWGGAEMMEQLRRYQAGYPVYGCW